MLRDFPSLTHPPRLRDPLPFRSRKARRRGLYRIAAAMACALLIFSEPALHLVAQDQTASSAEEETPSEPVIYQDFPVDRYQPLWAKSPFTLESVEVAPQAGFADDLALIAVVTLADTPYATIMNKKTQQRSMVTSKENKDGISLVSLNRSDKLEATSVVLKKGGETGTISYDPNLLRAPAVPAAAPPPPQANQPSQPTRVSGRSGGPPPRPASPTRRRRIIVPSQPPNSR
jgi:hypothetical protein